MTIREISARIGGLQCVIAEPESHQPPAQVVVLCHGFGAPGTDLVPLGAELLNLEPQALSRTRFVFPAAPLELQGGYFGSRAWWQIDIGRIQRQVLAGDLREIVRDKPDGLPHARRLLMGTLEELRRMTGLGLDRFVIGGFSQGAMLSTDVSLRLEEAPAALAILSGAVIAEDDWKVRCPQRAGLPVFQSHGTYDEILPFLGADWLKGLLSGSGLNVQFHSFPGGHGIPGDVMKKLAAFLASVFSPKSES